MASIGEALARGLESGWAMGRQREQDIEAKRQRELLEQRQAAADVRAEEELKLQRQRVATTEQRAATEYKLKGLKAAMEATGAEVSDVETEAKARAAGGQEITPELGARYGDAKNRAQAVRQQYLNLASRIQSGDQDINSVPSKELSAMLSLTTGYKPAELQAVPAAIKDFQAALDTKNMGLATDSLNTLLAPILKRGIGEPSAHGGNVTSKQIIRVLPAQDANGQVAPGMVYPVIRVFTDVKGPDGKELYYDAPLTQNGSTEAGDRIVPVSVQKFMGQLGNLGVLTTALSRPGLAERKAQGDKEAEAEINGYLDSLRMVSRPARKGATGEKIEAIEQYARQHNMTPQQASEELRQLGVFPGVGAATIRERLAAIDALDLPEDQKETLRRDVALGAGGRTTGLIPQRGKATSAVGAAGAGAPATSTALGGAQAPTKPDEAVDFWARAVIAGDRDWQIGIGRSKTGAQLIEAVKRRVPQLAKEMGLEPQDIGSTRAQQAALGATLKDLTKRSEAIELFSSKLTKDMKTYDAALDKAAMDSPLLINKPVNFLRRQFSDPALAQLDLAAKQVGTEYERLIAGGALSIAQLHAGAHEDAKALVNGDMPPKQARAVMETMLTEIQNSRDAARESRNSIQEQIRGLGRGRTPSPPSPRATVPAAPPVSFGTEAEAAAAAKAGKIKPGDRITIGGQTGTWQ